MEQNTDMKAHLSEGMVGVMRVRGLLTGSRVVTRGARRFGQDEVFCTQPALSQGRSTPCPPGIVKIAGQYII